MAGVTGESSGCACQRNRRTLRFKIRARPSSNLWLVTELEILGQPIAERADAAANRRKILAAAAELVAARGVAGLSMDDVAAAAGVGVGTVYRRFKDRAGLAHALLDQREHEFQERFMAGSPPLGPDAPPVDRIRAFLHALIDRTDDQIDLLLYAETSAPAARFEGSYGVYHRHLSMLISQERSDVDAEYTAHLLLAPMSADLFAWQRTDQRISVERMRAGIDILLDGLARPFKAERD